MKRIKKERCPHAAIVGPLGRPLARCVRHEGHKGNHRAARDCYTYEWVPRSLVELSIIPGRTRPGDVSSAPRVHPDHQPLSYGRLGPAGETRP